MDYVSSELITLYWIGVCVLGLVSAYYLVREWGDFDSDPDL
jgi:hypothetical protein